MSGSSTNNTRILNEIKTIGQNLEKALNENDISNTKIVDMLGLLSDFKMTRSLLKESKIGYSVSKVKKTSGLDENIIKQAKNLISNWRNVADSKNSTTTATDSATSSSSGSSSMDLKRSNTMDSVKSTNSSNDGGKKVVTISFSELKASNELVDDLPDLDKTKRSIMRKQFIDILTKNGKVTKYNDRMIELAIGIENELHKYSKEQGTVDAYKKKMMELSGIFNRITSLKRRVVLKEISFQELINSSAEQLASADEKKEMDAKKEEMEKQLISMKNAKQSNYIMDNYNDIFKSQESMYTCGRCKSANCIFYSMQTRCADEPMTNFVTCLKCQNKWKD